MISFPAVIDLSDRAKFRLSGPDRVRYLNGQVTNNVARLRAGETCYALVCNHKGKIEGDIFIRAEDDAFLIDAPGELREPLLARLGKYLIADDCEIEDVTEGYALWHELEAAGDAEVSAVSINRFGVPGRDFWALQPAEVPAATLAGAELERLRLEHAIPAWGSELTSNTLPQEARLQGRAVDFSKGCYIGQEVISRLKSVGHVTRELRALEATAGAGPLQAGDGLYVGEDLVEAGRVTSAAWHPGLEKTIALGYVKSTLAKRGTVFRAGKDKNALSSAVTFRDTDFA